MRDLQGEKRMSKFCVFGGTWEGRVMIEFSAPGMRT